MASTAWAHFLPYAADPSVALRSFQERAFSARAYRLPTDDIKEMDVATLNHVAPDISKLKKMLNMAKALDKAFAEIGADTTDQEKDTAGVEAFIRRAESDGFAVAAKSFAETQSPNDPTTIEDLRDLAAESGTHSILDIERVGSSPAFGTATPLTDHQLINLFGTLQPTFEMVQSVHQTGAIVGLCERWQAIYFPVYSNGHPAHYFFAGNSGD